jgi:hypothetical protein
MTLPDAKHPIWPLLRTVVVMSGACFMLTITATSFDSGELKAVGGVGAASLAFDIIKRALAP